MDKQKQDLDTGAWHWTDEYVESLEAKVERLEKWQDALRQRLHMAEQQIRECRQYLRLDDRDLVIRHINAYFALPALNSGEGMR